MASIVNRIAPIISKPILYNNKPKTNNNVITTKSILFKNCLSFLII